MDAKCPQCEKVAILNDDVTIVKCPHCGFEATYDKYLELMKQKIGTMVENFQFDKPGGF